MKKISVWHDEESMGDSAWIVSLDEDDDSSTDTLDVFCTREEAIAAGREEAEARHLPLEIL